MATEVIVQSLLVENEGNCVRQVSQVNTSLMAVGATYVRFTDVFFCHVD